jgi:hypothetical protein
MKLLEKCNFNMYSAKNSQGWNTTQDYLGMVQVEALSSIPRTLKKDYIT